MSELSGRYLGGKIGVVPLMSPRNTIASSSLTEEPLDPAVIRCVPRRCCLLCGDEGENLYAALIDWASGVSGRWGILLCSACGAGWLDPQPVAEDIQKLYPSLYYTHRSMPGTRFDPLRQATLRCILARMGYPVERAKGLLPRLLSCMRSSARAAALDVMGLSASQVGSLLDVGCGNGQFMLRMRSLGWGVSGVDPDPAAVALGQSHGLRVFRGSICDVPGTDTYDAITLSHVIEHVADPIKLLRECRKRLRPNTGRLLVTTPNIDSLGHWWFRRHWFGLEVPRHLNLFSSKGLSRCATRAGLNVISLSTETRMAHTIYNPSVCARKGERNVGERTDFKVRTKVASYFFQLLEDALIRVKPDVGEEIFCVCGTPVNS